MKTIILIAVIVVLVVLFGTIPLAVISQIFTWLASVFSWLADLIDIFGFGGIMKGG